MNKIILVLFMCITSFFVNAQKTEMSPQVFGKYVAYKCLALPVNELAYSEAKSLLGGKLIIQNKNVIIFNDTLKDVSYSIAQSDQIDFYRVYRHFDYRKLGIKESTINVLSVTPEDVVVAPIDIVITQENFLAVEYKSYIFLFRKQNK